MKESLLSLLLDTRKAKRQGVRGIVRRQRTRLAEMVAYARTHSPYYRELYSHLPEHVEDHGDLPVTSKKELMARFNDWATDRRVTIEAARPFAENPELIGERFLADYTLVTTSGTTGTPGIFVMDDRSFTATAALAVRMLTSWLTPTDFIRIVVRGGRMAMVMATGGHYASAVAASKLRKRSKRRARRTMALSAHTPLPELVARLNEFRPVILAPYASMAALLANEQEAGRLHIRPVLTTLSAEGLPGSEYERIANAFHTKLGNSYAATECPFLSYSCEEGWLHVNSDWLLLEPVDANYRAIPPGQRSHTVLISNLANRVQPIIRYDLGDSVVQRPGACPCGNPLPAIRVQGRSGDVLTFTAGSGKQVSIPPLAFEVDHIDGIELFQIKQSAPTSLRLRLQTATDVDHVWQKALAAIKDMLATHGLEHVSVERAEEPPEQSAGGKYRTVIPLEVPKP